MWNVKIESASAASPALDVLIETLWNVKCRYSEGNTKKEERINRNIVECKGDPDVRYTTEENRINRNIVECKGGKEFWHFLNHRVLIETLWNVKSKAVFVCPAVAFGINRNIVECKDKRAVCNKCGTSLY